MLLLAVGYLVHVVTREQGPLNLFERLRQLPLTVGDMLSCPICAAFWLSLLVVFFDIYLTPLVKVLALAGFITAVRTVWKKADFIIEALTVPMSLAVVDKISDLSKWQVGEQYLYWRHPEIRSAKDFVEYNEAAQDAK